MKQEKLLQKSLDGAYTYPQYRSLIDSLLEDGKTTGPDQSESMIEYAKLNQVRMNKWEKHFIPDADVLNLLKQWDRNEIWLVITEGWCGDAAHAVPVMNHLAEASQAIEMKLVLRDENPSLMDIFLSGGKRKIPKLIRLDAQDLRVISTWGPQPQEAEEMVTRLKKAGLPAPEIKKDLQIWYARNRGKAIERELAAMLAQ